MTEPDQAARPEWVAELAAKVEGLTHWPSTRFRAPLDFDGRQSAVLLLFGVDDDGEVDLVFIQRSHSLRSHPGQPAFPGGGMDPEDADHPACALREATEEIGLDPSTVEVIGELPTLWVSVSGYVVTPVVGWWRRPHPVWPVDLAEVERVERIPLRDLVDPANRYSVRHSSGFVGPAFILRDLTIWGFTGGLLSTLLDEFGWAVPWDADRVVPLAAE